MTVNRLRNKVYRDYTGKKIAFLSDFHIHFPGFASSPERYVKAPFGDGIESAEKMHEILEWYLDQGYEVVLCGDVLDTTSTNGIKNLLETDSIYSKEFRRIMEDLKSWIDSGRVVYILGNHDEPALLDSLGIQYFDVLEAKTDSGMWTVSHGHEFHDIQKVVGFGQEGIITKMCQKGPRPLQVLARLYGLLTLLLERPIRDKIRPPIFEKTTKNYGNSIIGHLHCDRTVYTSEHGTVYVVPKAIDTEKIAHALELVDGKFKYARLDLSQEGVKRLDAISYAAAGQGGPSQMAQAGSQPQY